MSKKNNLEFSNTIKENADLMVYKCTKCNCEYRLPPVQEYHYYFCPNCRNKMIMIGDNKELKSLIHPPYYQIGGIEAFEIIMSTLSRDELIGYLMGQILNYTRRTAYKGQLEEDWDKARWYYERLQEEL